MPASNAKARDSFEPEKRSGDIYQTGSGSTSVPDPVRKQNTSNPDPERKQSDSAAIETSVNHEARISSQGVSYADFFAATSGPAQEHFRSGTDPDPERKPEPSGLNLGMTLKEAVDFYKISERTIRVRIKDGKIPALKVKGANVPEWRVYPNGLPELPQCGTSTEPDPDQNTIASEPEIIDFGPDPDWNQTGSEPATDSTLPVVAATALHTPEVQTLLDMLARQSEKLEAASLRIGYLQSQTDSYEKQIKLLTDSQHKKGWWSRFGAWLVGKK